MHVLVSARRFRSLPAPRLLQAGPKMTSVYRKSDRAVRRGQVPADRHQAPGNGPLSFRSSLVVHRRSTSRPRHDCRVSGSPATPLQVRYGFASCRSRKTLGGLHLSLSPPYGAPQSSSENSERRALPSSRLLSTSHSALHLSAP